MKVQVAVKNTMPSEFGEFNVINIGQQRTLVSSLSGKSSKSGPRHRLEDKKDLLVIYDLKVSFQATNKFKQQEIQNSISDTFSKEKKTLYIAALRESGDSSFSSVTDVASSIDGALIGMSLGAPLEESRGITFYAPIVAGCIVLLFGSIFWRRKVLHSVNSAETPIAESLLTPDLRIESTIEVDAEEATISTLGNPIPANDVFGAFGGVSTAERKSAESPGFLRNSNNTLTSEVSSSEQLSVNQSSVSLFTDDDSIEMIHGGVVASQDERVEVYAPAGKLGMVIDTPLSGIPIVHAIKEISVLVNQVQIGDKLLSVDGTDTTEMSAIQVSKLISSKEHSERILVFARTPT